MTFFVLGVKCGFLGASGFFQGVLPSAAQACVPRKPSSPSIAASATPVNPHPISHRNCRRVRPQKPPEAAVRLGVLITISVRVWLTAKTPRAPRLEGKKRSRQD